MATDVEALFRVTTPMFCAGANAERAELRLPSLKGTLRFWWRALAWSRLGGDLKKVQRDEDTLFGSTATGQALLSMQLQPFSAPATASKGEVLGSPTTGSPVGEGARYLGYGVMEAFYSRVRGTKAGELTRACLRAPLDVTVRMRLRERGSEAERSQRRASLEEALICVGTVGGLGAKNRKGYGSLAIQSLVVDGENRWRQPQTLSELDNAVAKLRCDGPTELPPYTAFSAKARHLLLAGNKTQGIELLDLVGRELMRYRSWGHNGKVLGGCSERNFKDDHDLMRGGRRNKHPRRVAFGLPHNYGRNQDQQVGPWESGLDRRASPLFLHIHECGNTPVAVLSFLPATFLPKDQSDLSVGGSRVRQVPEAKLYRPIHEFLDRLLDPAKRKEPFTEVVEIGR